jgi:hypothetical protein
MSRTEQRILVTQAGPGMILARPVVLPDKMVLVGSGATLSDEMIARLMKRGIKRIHVRGNPIPSPGHDDWQERLKRLYDRFERVQHIPFMAALRQVVEREMARRI